MEPQTIQTQTAPAISQQPDIFDQLASGQSAPATPAQSTAPTPTPTAQPTTSTPAPEPAQPQSGSGDIFDQLATNPNSMAGNAPTATTTPTAQTGLQHGLSVLQGDTDQDGSWYPELGNMMAGAIKSASNGLAGIIDWINKPKGQLLQTPDPDSIKASIAFYRRIHPEASQQQAIDFVQRGIDAGRQPFSSTVQDVSDWLHSAGQPDGFWQNVGSIGEQALEWIGLDGVTKLASAPAKAAEAGKAATGAVDTVQHLAQAGTVAKVLQDNPKLAGIVSIGLKAAKDAVTSGVQQFFHSDDNPMQATESGLIAGTLSGVLHGTGALVNKGIQAIRAATDTQAVQDALQNTIRSILAKTAAENKVPAPSAQSLRDAAGEVGNSVKAQASKLYKALDDAIGGTRFQTFDEQLSAVRDELRNSANIDHDAHGELIEKYNALEDAKHAAELQAIENGVDPATIHEANAKWRTGSAMLDLQKDLQMAAHGLRPELHAGLQPGQVAAPETINPGTLATRANRSYNSGRLMQALNPQNADDLLRAVESAALREKQVAANQTRLHSILKTAAHGAAYGVGLGGAGGVAYEAGKHLAQ